MLFMHLSELKDTHNAFRFKFWSATSYYWLSHFVVFYLTCISVVLFKIKTKCSMMSICLFVYFLIRLSIQSFPLSFIQVIMSPAPPKENPPEPRFSTTQLRVHLSLSLSPAVLPFSEWVWPPIKSHRDLPMKATS